MKGIRNTLVLAVLLTVPLAYGYAACWVPGGDCPYLETSLGGSTNPSTCDFEYTKRICQGGSSNAAIDGGDSGFMGLGEACATQVLESWKLDGIKITIGDPSGSIGPFPIDVDLDGFPIVICITNPFASPVLVATTPDGKCNGPTVDPASELCDDP